MGDGRNRDKSNIRQIRIGHFKNPHYNRKDKQYKEERKYGCKQIQKERESLQKKGPLG
jgi:hypothetical protein